MTYVRFVLLCYALLKIYITPTYNIINIKDFLIRNYLYLISRQCSKKMRLERSANIQNSSDHILVFDNNFELNKGVSTCVAYPPAAIKVFF